MNNLSNYINIIGDYIWIPILLPLTVFFIKSLLYVKEIRKHTDADIEEFVSLYNARIKDNLRICAEEILQFIGKGEKESIEHHLYICKKFNKTIGFVKFMYSCRYKYLFLAYIAIDKNDHLANKYGLKLMIKKIYKEFVKKKKANLLITEIERGTDGTHVTALSKLISRYAKMYKAKSYFLDFDYMQPNMPNDNFDAVPEEILSLVYIPIYHLANNRISKTELISLLQSIYFEIYYPSCNEITLCDCNNYNTYLESLIKIYAEILPEYIFLSPIDKQT